jgi:hypothetical protein
MSKIGDIGIKATGTVTEISDAVTSFINVLGPAAAKVRDQIENLLNGLRQHDLLDAPAQAAQTAKLDAIDKAIEDA